MPVKSGHKAAKGTVGVEKFRGKLRLRLPRQIFGGKQKYISTGLADTPENWKRTQSKAWQIEEDITTGNFDSSLEKYRPASHLTLLPLSEEVSVTSIALNDLWDKYTAYKSTQVEETTLRLNFKRVASHINKLDTKSLQDGMRIRDFLVANNSPYTVKRILTQLNACCDWGVKSGMIDSNPFTGMSKEIQSPKNSDGTDIDPFTAQERDAIVQAFREHPKYNHYANFVSFLFMTGCRTSEAIALRWKHINNDCSKIVFSEALVNVSSKVIRKGLKTQDKRSFPCNTSLQNLLLKIRPENYEAEASVFTAPNGKEVNAHTFHTLAWKGFNQKGKQHIGIVQHLANEGLIERYKPQYQTRHTFITLALDNNMDAKDVARLVGNSPEIIYKHYAGKKRNLFVPEF